MKRKGKMAMLTGVIVIKIAVVSVFILNQGFGREDVILNNQEWASNPVEGVSVPIPDSLFFAGERVPLENFDTRESLDRELTSTSYRHASTILIIKRANRYFPIIEKILVENGIPSDFKYLVAAESEMVNVVSPVGATGFWQIMESTGKEYGLEINSEVDERYHIEKSTLFAISYLKKSYEKYNNWTLAAASYNGGRAGVDKQIGIQGENNYYDLLLTDETARYLFRILSYKLIISDPQKYGFDIPESQRYQPLRYIELKVDSAIPDFGQFAKDHGTNYKLLKFLNPWLRQPMLTNKQGKEYIIKMPEQGSRIIVD